jgi:hypothetical protein
LLGDWRYYGSEFDPRKENFGFKARLGMIKAGEQKSHLGQPWVIDNAIGSLYRSANGAAIIQPRVERSEALGLPSPMMPK